MFTTQTIATLTNVLPSLATLTSGSVRTARVGKRVRLYRTEASLLHGSALTVAVRDLLTAAPAARIRVYEGQRIYTASLENGAVIWSVRQTSKVRSLVVVEVTL